MPSDNYDYNIADAKKTRKNKTLELLRIMTPDKETFFTEEEKKKIAKAKELKFDDKKLVKKINDFIKKNKTEFMSFQKLSVVQKNYKVEDSYKISGSNNNPENSGALISTYGIDKFQSSADRRSGMSNYWLHNISYNGKNLWKSDLHSSAVIVPYKSKDGKKTIIDEAKTNAKMIYDRFSLSPARAQKASNKSSDDNNETSQAIPKPKLILYQTLIKPGLVGYITGKENKMLKYKNYATYDFYNELKGEDKDKDKGTHLLMLRANHSANMSIFSKVNNYLCNNIFFGTSLWGRRKIVQKLKDLSEQMKKTGENTTLIKAAIEKYDSAMNTTCPNRRDMLSRAAYELIAINHMSGLTHTTCKSGKDRVGMVKLFSDALLVFFEKNRQFPDLYKKEDQQKFATVFNTLFNSEHMQKIADLNSPGAYGLKSMKDVLPDFLYQALQEADIAKPNKFIFFKEAAKLNNQTCKATYERSVP